MNEVNYTPINKGQSIIESPERHEAFERKRGYGCEESYKENRRQWYEYPKKQFVSNYPLHVDIELASVCNLKCPMCYTITKGFKKRVNAKLMDFTLFTKLVDECASGEVFSIRLSWRGESFLHKKVIECISYAKAKGIQEVSSLTNGVSMDEKQFKKIMIAGLDWLTISIDGMGEMYERIRKPSKFDRMVEKLTNFKKIKEKAGKVKPVIKVQGIFPSISEDPEGYYRTFAPITDQVATNPLIDYLQNDNQSMISYHENFVCPQIFQRLTIAADGQVLLCSNDENNEYVIGDANIQTINEIWHGKRMTSARKLHAEHIGNQKLNPCQHCYLPRRTEDQEIFVGGQTIILENYINRSQVIGK